MTAARARNSDPATSHYAAESVTGITELQRRILQVFEEYGAMTDERLIVNYHKMWGNIHKDTDSSIRSRRSQLVHALYIVAVSENGESAAGNKATIWNLAGLLW